MASSHLKRLVAPKTWPIVRKTTKFVTRPKPNGQKIEFTMPVVLVMRDILGLVRTAKQARTIMRTQPVTVNGQRVYDTDSSVGFMDVLAVDGKGYRVCINENNKLTVVPVKKDEDFIVQKIVGKTTVGKGKTQVNLASGRNILAAKDGHKVGDSIAIDKTGKIIAHYPLSVGAFVILTGGLHIGKIGTVEKLEGKTITVKSGSASVDTATNHAYVIGTGKPAITTSKE